MFTGVTSINTNHLGYLNATTVILPCNTRSVENYSIRNSRITNLVITYTAGTFAFNGSWNNSSSISYIYVPDTKISAYSGRTVYPIVGKESIIEKDREFSLSIPSAKFGWAADLQWSVEENDYISIVSQEDGVATFRAAGISEDTTDTTVTISYQSNNGNGFFKGTKVLTIKHISTINTIEFKDPEVKRICVANWGGPLCISTKVPGIPGEITYEQAAGVTSIGTAFYNNKIITEFKEFAYFTKVGSLGGSAFEGCTKLKYLDVPPSVASVAFSSIRNNPAMVWIIFRRTTSMVTASGNNALHTVSGYVYVPDDLLDDYLAYKNWGGQYPTKFKALSTFVE